MTLVAQKLPSLERRAKSIYVSPSWRDAVGLARRPDLAEHLIEIRRYIEADLDLPEPYYRKDRHTTPDRLLDETGILHLHLGSPDTPELLYLVQFPRDVVLLEISNHYHFDIEPPGSVLRQLHESKLDAWIANREAQIELLKADIRARLLKSKGEK